MPAPTDPLVAPAASGGGSGTVHAAGAPFLHSETDLAGGDAAPDTTGALGRADRFVGWIERATALISGIGIFLLMLVGVVHVLGRKFFNAPIFGYIDIVEIMMSFLVFLGLAYTERLGGHIRMELFVTRLKGRALALFELAGVVLGLIVVGVLVVYSWEHAMRAFWLGDSTIDAELPLWPSKLVVSASLALLFIRLLVSLWAYVRLLLDPSKTPVAVPEVIDAEEQALREAESAGAFNADLPYSPHRHGEGSR